MADEDWQLMVAKKASEKQGYSSRKRTETERQRQMQRQRQSDRDRQRQRDRDRCRDRDSQTETDRHRGRQGEELRVNAVHCLLFISLFVLLRDRKSNVQCPQRTKYS